MKRLAVLLAGFIFTSMSGWANDWNSNSNQAFIFTENGIEFSVFQDGQFDFFIPNSGPNVSAGFRTSNVNFSFNTGYNYNPYVQYDSYGAVIQIQNTPIFYDNFGRIHQVGSIYMDYTSLGRLNRIGGLQLFYRNNMLWRQSGFINHINRSYVWRPWHNYYAMPAAQFNLIGYYPYRQFYVPVRHIYYRPYINNNRHFTFNRHQTNYRRGANSTRSQAYAQSPRTRAERNLRSNVQRRHKEINASRNSRLSSANTTRRENSRSISEVHRSANRDASSRVNRAAAPQEVKPNVRRNQVSGRSSETTSHRSISQRSTRPDKARSSNRRTSEVSGRNSVQTKPAPVTRTKHNSERSSRSNSSRSSRNR